MPTQMTDQTIHRANNKDSICVYCKAKIGMAMQCPGCGHIDPPVTSPTQMTDQEILLKAIDKVYGSDQIVNPNFIRAGNYYRIIFSHQFAKDFFGEEEVCSLCGQIFEPDKNNALMCRHCVENNDPEWKLGDTFIIEAWEYHLQHMVLESNPIKYLEKFL